jgi:predicted GNAT family N-acyltransferase
MEGLSAMTTEDKPKTIGAAARMMRFEARHVPGALKLSQEMGWPYRREDWDFAAAAGHGLALERDGKVIGTSMWWTYGQAHASAGMIIVTAAEQGHGYGARLFDGLLDATAGRVVLLNSTDEGLELYKRRGFTAWGTVVQHQGLLTVDIAVDAGQGIRPATASDLLRIQEFDRRATGMDRAPLVAALVAAGHVLVIERAGRIAGYSIARRFGRGHVIGPCAAENVEDAQRLILAQLATLQGQFVRIDVYAEHGLSGWLDSLGIAEVARATAMVNGPLPVAEGDACMYALANQSFG